MFDFAGDIKYFLRVKQSTVQTNISSEQTTVLMFVQ